MNSVIQIAGVVWPVPSASLQQIVRDPLKSVEMVMS